MLVLDAFRCHRMPSVKDALKRDNTELVILPGGMTRILQPLDVSVNKPIKNAMRAKWNAWLQTGNHTFTLVDITTWIVEAWRELDLIIIENRLKKCCISNGLDGSEDDVLWTTPTEEKRQQTVMTTKMTMMVGTIMMEIMKTST